MAGEFKVLVVGGGLGGLCLAQGLKKAGIACEVFERDQSKVDRVQGYRIHIDPDGSRALHACLPPRLFEAFDKTCGKNGAGFAFATEQLEELLSTTQQPHADDGVAVHRSVSRVILRQVLLGGLDDIVHFDRKFARYEKVGDKVTVYFEDGTSSTGDLLVGADGVNSGVRAQFLPDAAPVDTGVVGIAGKLPLTDEVKALMSHPCLTSSALIHGPKGRTIFVGRHEFTAPDIVNEYGLELTETSADYAMWGFFAKLEKYNFRTDFRKLPPTELRDVVLAQMEGWHPRLIKLVSDSDLSTIYAWPMRVAPSIKPWASTNVTLIGDAVHSMPPTGGIGGNIALRDASELVDRLMSVSDLSDPSQLVEAIGQYEARMFKYAFDAVRSSLGMMRESVNESALRLAATRMFFRTVNRMPALKRTMFS